MPRKTLYSAGDLMGVGGRFNEAAARCRGKRVRRALERGLRVASMRPRPDAAENGMLTGVHATGASSLQ